MARTSPSEEGRGLWRSVGRVSSLAEVCEAISAASTRGDAVHVERWASGWRWSPAHRGGPYPLLRIVARLLEIPHHGIPMPYKTNPQRCAFVPPNRRSRPLATATLTPEGPLDAGEARRRILAALPAAKPGKGQR